MVAFAMTPPTGYAPLPPEVHWNPSDLSGVTLSNANLSASGTAQGAVRATQSFSSGKYYWEVSATATAGNANTGFGICSAAATLSTVAATPNNAVICQRSGLINVNGSSSGITDGVFGSGAPTTNGVAVDFTAGHIWFRNSAASTNWNGSTSNDPVAGTGGINIGGIAGPYFPLYACGASGEQATANFAGDTYAVITQAALEQWAQGTPQAQLTQLAIEQWVSGSVNTQALITQIALEQWAATGLGGITPQARVMVMV